MEVAMALNAHALVRLPISWNSRTTTIGSIEDYCCSSIIRHSISSSRKSFKNGIQKQQQKPLMVVEAKGKRGMQGRQFQRPLPPMPKIEDDGNPRFVIFVRMAKVYLWYPVSIVSGGTTAKIMVAAKDNFLGKYIYKDTLARNLAAVIYNDEKQVKETATRQHRVLRGAKEFRYGYKLVEGTDVRAALSNSDVIELPTQDELKTVLDKVKDFFGDAKESFGKLTSLNTETTTEVEETADKKSKVKS